MWYRHLEHLSPVEATEDAVNGYEGLVESGWAPLDAAPKWPMSAFAKRGSGACVVIHYESAMDRRQARRINASPDIYCPVPCIGPTLMLNLYPYLCHGGI